MTPALVGVYGPALTPDERALFRDTDPAGYILFGRNVVDRGQLRALTDSLRELAGRDVPVLIDQEGGIVARLRPPEWPAFPGGGVFDRLYEHAPSSAIAAALANGAALGAVLAEVGVSVDCHPILDVARPETTDAIGARVFGREPLRVAALGRATLEGLARAGVLGVIKHMPGHGRATVDSHDALPRVTASAAELEQDLAPFRTLARRATIGMTAHVVYDAWDAERPATLSPVVIDDVIRTRIGFDGLLLSDDLHMRALTGTLAERGAAALAAGVDLVLACHATASELTELAMQPMTAAAVERLDRAMSGRKAEAVDLAEQLAIRDSLLHLVAAA